MDYVTETSISRFNRRKLANEALQAAVATREQAGLDQAQPICIYELCDKLGIIVRFNAFNMEGMYQRGAQPRIHLSARRPLARRVFNCAHELGHHVFNHGSTIDELRKDLAIHSNQDPKEFLADSFAGFILMPVLGMRRAFSTRGLTQKTAEPIDIYTIASEFGVGYSTLLTHLSSSMRTMPHSRAALLKRTQPKTVRNNILGSNNGEALLILDRYCTADTVDTEVRTLVLLPHDTTVKGNSLVVERDLPIGRLYRALRPGIDKAQNLMWSMHIRVSPTTEDRTGGFVGLARFRHLEEDSSE